jgi:hypothetical protein
MVFIRKGHAKHIEEKKLSIPIAIPIAIAI